MKKKLAIITPYLSGTGGTETVLKTVLKKIPKDVSVNLIVLGLGKETLWLSQLDSNVEITIISPTKIKKLWGILKKIVLGNYERIICLSTEILFIVYLIRTVFIKNYSIISWIHFSIFNEPSVQPNKLKYADFNLAISKGIAKQLESLGIQSSKIGLVYNPVTQKTRIIKCNKSKPKSIGYIGRIMLDGQKNLRELFDGLGELKPNSVTVNLWGSGEIGKCQQYIEEHEIQQEFKWHGWVKNPWDEISNMDAVVLTSKFEGFPMALLEAISYGIPVVSTDCPTGPSDLISFKNGYLYEIGDIHDLARKLEKVIQNNFNSKIIRKTAQEYYVENYVDRFWNYVFKDFR